MLPPARANPLVAAVKTISQKMRWPFARSGRYVAPLGTRDTRRKDRKQRGKRADRRHHVSVAIQIGGVQQPERALGGRHRGRDDILKEDRAAQTRVSTSMSPSAPARRARSSASIQIFRITRGSVSPLVTCSISWSVKRRGSPIA